MRDTEIFNQLNNFLENFKAPKTIKIYDYENDRATPINKFLFTEETITIKDQEKEKKVKVLEEEVHSIGRKLDEQNRELFNTVKHELTDHLIIHAKKNEELKENQGINLNDINLREGFSDTIFKEINYKNLNNLSQDEIHAYEQLGVSIEKKIDEVELKKLKDKLDKNEITLEDYKKEYKTLEDKSFNVEVSEAYLEPLIKTFFNKIKPNAMIKDLEWLNERFIFMPEDPRRRINDKEGASLTTKPYKRPYDSFDTFRINKNNAISEGSLIEAIATKMYLFPDKLSKINFEYPLERHKPKNGPDINMEPIYNMNFPKENSDKLLKGGVAHLFRDHPAYLLHLNYAYGDGKYIWLGIEENRKYLSTGYKPNSFSYNIVNRTQELSIRDKKLFDIKNYEEIQNMNLSKDEKFDLFLKILYAMDSNPVKERLTANEYVNLANSDTIDFSKASKNSILEYFKFSNELNPTKELDENGVPLKRKRKLASKEEDVGITGNYDKLDLNKDFYLVHGIYNHVYKKFDFDREIQSKYILKNYWDNIVKPWLNIEESRNMFFNNVRYKVSQDLDLTSSSRRTYLNNRRSDIKDFINSCFNRYSIDARNSEHFTAKIIPEVLADEIVESINKAITNNNFKTNREKSYSNEVFGSKWENNLAATQQDVEDVLRKDALKNHYSTLINEAITEIEGYTKYQYSMVGEQGKKILDATLLHVKEQFLNTDNLPDEINIVNIFVKNTKIQLEKMIEEYKDPNYISRKQPPYFPTIRHMIENWNLDLEKDDIHPIYEQINKIELIEQLGSNENFANKLPTNKLFKLGLYNIEDRHINPLNNIAYQLMKDKEKFIGENFKAIKNEKEGINYNRNILVELYKKKESLEDKRTLSIEELNQKLKEFVDSKIDNRIVDNKIDNEKMIEIMKLIVRMTQNFENKDKIIDLSNVENISNELSKLDSKLSNVNDITKAGLVLNYIFTMNELYKKNSVDKNEISIDLLNIDKPKAMVLQNIIEREEGHKNYILNELNDKYIKESITLNDNFSYHHDNSIKDKFENVEVYNGKHFPLFIDLETLTIFSVEWTTRYPTLNVVTLPEQFSKLELDNDLNRKNKLYDLENRTLEHKMDCIKLNKHVELIDEDLNKVENKEYYDFHPLNHKNILDRVSIIFSTIQTNYFIQLKQSLENSLFIDADPLYLGEHVLNDGAIAFMNKKDYELLDQDIKNNENRIDFLSDTLKYTDKYNFVGYEKYKNDDLNKEFEDVKKGRAKHVYEEDYDEATIMFKKVNGFPSEKFSKRLSKENSLEKNNFDLIYDNKDIINIEDLPRKNDILYKIETLTNLQLGATLKNSGNKIFKKDNLDNLQEFKENFKSFKLFETKEELELYKNNINSFLNTKI